MKKYFLLTDRIERRYFSGVDIAEGYMLVGEEKIYFADARYFYALKEKLEGSGIRPVLFENINSIKTEIQKLNIKTLYLDFSICTVKEYKSYKDFGAKLKDGKELLDKIFSVKKAGEIKSIEKACKIAEKAFYKTLPFIKEGITELEVKDILEKFMIELGVEGSSFETIVAFGENSAVPHHETSGKKLCENSPVLMDFGCKVNGYCSDITRTLYFGNPSDKFIKAYNCVLSANKVAEEKITVSMTGKEADKIARDILRKENYDKYFTHSLGHGVGLNIHESPYLSPKSNDTIKNGNVFSIEPGVYFDGEFGIRIEDTVMLRGGKVKRMFTDSKELKIIK